MAQWGIGCLTLMRQLFIAMEWCVGCFTYMSQAHGVVHCTYMRQLFNGSWSGVLVALHNYYVVMCLTWHYVMTVVSRARSSGQAIPCWAAIWVPSGA